jgi:hypothetical protein
MSTCALLCFQLNANIIYNGLIKTTVKIKLSFYITFMFHKVYEIEKEREVHSRYQKEHHTNVLTD